MNTNRALRRAAAAVGLAAGLIVSSGSIAGAGEPRNQACVGQSLSALATTQPFPGAFGAGVRGFAQDPNLPPPGLGDGLQALQAGLVPDDIVPNTCND
jgi:hypothetical protein